MKLTLTREKALKKNSVYDLEIRELNEDWRDHSKAAFALSEIEKCYYER